MSDVLVRFTADIAYRCTGDVVHLSAAERKAVDKEAKFLNVHPAYQVIEKKAQEPTPEAPADEPVTDVAEEDAGTPAQSEEDSTNGESQTADAAQEPTPEAPAEIQPKPKKGAKK